MDEGNKDRPIIYDSEHLVLRDNLSLQDYREIMKIASEVAGGNNETYRSLVAKLDKALRSAPLNTPLQEILNTIISQS